MSSFLCSATIFSTYSSDDGKLIPILSCYRTSIIWSYFNFSKYCACIPNSVESTESLVAPCRCPTWGSRFLLRMFFNQCVSLLETIHLENADEWYQAGKTHWWTSLKWKLMKVTASFSLFLFLATPTDLLETLGYTQNKGKKKHISTFMYEHKKHTGTSSIWVKHQVFRNQYSHIEVELVNKPGSCSGLRKLKYLEHTPHNNKRLYASSMNSLSVVLVLHQMIN